MTTYTQSAPQLWRFQCDPAADGTCTVQAFFRSTLTNDSDPADTITKDGGAVSFDLPADLALQVISLAEQANSPA